MIDKYLYKKSGYLTVIDLEKCETTNRTILICQCICGNIRKHQTCDISSGNNKSCGCKSPTLQCTAQNYGNLRKGYLNRIAYGAKKRGLIFDLSIADAYEIYIRQDKKCALSKLPIKLPSPKTKHNIFQTGSLDRIDSDDGYTINNTQWICIAINTMKLDYPENRFIELCNLVAEHSD